MIRSGRRVRALMLGWEYPPRFAGGLGKACQGLSQAMARQGAQVFFVLPTFPDRVMDERLEVVGAREVLAESGFDPDIEVTGSRDFYATQSSQVKLKLAEGGGPDVTFIQSDAKLYPYGAAPSGPIPERLVRMLKQVEGDIESARQEIFKDYGARLKSVGKPEAKTSEGPKPAENRSDKQAEKQAENKVEAVKSSEIYGKNLWSEIERFAFTVRHLAEGHDVDVIHAHDWMTFPAAFEFQRMTGTPVFLHVHATEYDRSGENLNNDIFRIEREGFRKATHIFAVSRYTAGIIERLYGVNRRKISVVYNAPDEDIREVLASPDAPRKARVVFLGRLTFQKGPDHFVRAARLVAEADPDARFLFCGTGDMMDQLRAQVHQLALEDKFHFAGFVDPSGVDEILMDSKVLVMPSVSEPFGLVALEAVRCGIPVIISKQSGVREVLHRALQVDFWDHDKLADQILAALRLPDLSRQLVMEGMEQMQNLSWDKSATQVIDVYRRYLGTTYAMAVGGAHGH